MSRAALYLRLSKEDMDKDKEDERNVSESIQNQRLLLTDYALEKGFEIAEVYSDEDYSGLYSNRPAFERLIRDSRLGKFDTVIAKSQSRFTRNMEHVEKYLHHDFPLLGIRFIGVVDGVDTHIPGNKKARQIYGLTNEWYCEDLSDNIRAVFKQKMKDGQFIGGFAPYGYQKDINDKHKLVIDPFAADVVRRIFELYIKGYSVGSICHILEDDGIPNPTVYKRKQGLTYANAKSVEFGIRYNLWSTTTVNRILRNETYTGKLIQGTNTKVSYKDKRVISVPKEKWIVVEHCHEAIIDEVLFGKVRALAASRRITHDGQGKEKKVHLLAGKIKCQDCGATMIKSGGVKNKKNDWYMRCQLSNKTRKRECTSHNIRYSAVCDAVLHAILEVVQEINEDEWNEIFSMVQNKMEQLYGCKGQSLSKLETDASNVLKSLKLLYQDRASGHMDEKMFIQIREQLKANQAQIQLQIIKIKEKNDDHMLKSIWGERVQKMLENDQLFHELTHEMVSDFVKYVEVGEKNDDGNQDIMIHWIF